MTQADARPLARLRPAGDASIGAWIARELTGPVGSVTGTVPDRFDSYVRILHPARSPDGTPVTWADVANSLGRSMHARRQWHILVGSSDPDGFEGSRWDGQAPDRGDLLPDRLESLCGVLGRHTPDPEHCFFGLWTGWNLVAMHFSERRAGEEPVPPASSRSGNEIAGPRLALPPNAGRDYVLLAGSLSAAADIRLGDGEVSGGLAPTSPNLIWPADRSWFLASEIDFDSTLVGGTKKLVDAIVASEGLEAWPVEPLDSLAADGDDA